MVWPIYFVLPSAPALASCIRLFRSVVRLLLTSVLRACVQRVCVLRPSRSVLVPAVRHPSVLHCPADRITNEPTLTNVIDHANPGVLRFPISICMHVRTTTPGRAWHEQTYQPNRASPTKTTNRTFNLSAFSTDTPLNQQTSPPSSRYILCDAFVSNFPFYFYFVTSPRSLAIRT